MYLFLYITSLHNISVSFIIKLFHNNIITKLFLEIMMGALNADNDSARHWTQCGGGNIIRCRNDRRKQHITAK